MKKNVNSSCVCIDRTIRVLVMSIGRKPQQDDEARVRNLKRRTRFGQFTNQSMHTLASLTRNKGLKQSISKKKVAIRSRWKEIASRAALQEDDTTDGRTRKISTPVNKFGRAVLAAAAKEKARLALENAQKSNDDDYDDVALDILGRVEEEEQTVIANFDKEDEAKDGDPYYSVIQPKAGPSSQSEPGTSQRHDDDEGMDMSNVILQVPKVEDDEWPEEDVYANADANEASDMNKADVRF